MEETLWICERCGEIYDLEEEEWVELVEDEKMHQICRVPASPEPYRRVCYDCVDELLEVIERCNKDCLHCEVTLEWGLSVMECLKLQKEFEFEDLFDDFPEEEYLVFYDKADKAVISGFFMKNDF
ncbi:MAG: hypothetical protein ACXQTS_02730 [Candidatus Methanospirareceae archaeon]